jgi:hypothetical protein
MLSIIPLPSGFTADILANTSTILTDLSGYITLIISIILIGVVIEIIVGAVKRH